LILTSACGPRVREPKSSPATSAAVPLCPSPAPQDPPLGPSRGDESSQDHKPRPVLPSGTQTADPAVTFVSAGGYWESGSARGRYRVVVKTHCGEHCVEEVLLEQIDESAAGGSIRRVVPVPETAPMRVESVNFWPTGKWNGEVEFRLTGDDGKHSSRLCLKVTDGNNTTRNGPCAQ